jgi:putative phosphoesterase
MRVAAVYDVHGNLPALEAVLGEVRDAAVDLVVVGGDVVPGPMPREALDLLLELDLPVRFIHGNGEVAVLSVMRGEEPTGVPAQFREMIRWCADQLGRGYEPALSAWPLTIRATVEGLGQVLFCHATPRNENEIFTRLTAEERLAPVFRDVNADVVVCGHTHMQFDRSVGGVRVVNAGSVGMPFGAPGACWLLLDGEIHLRRTAYDLTATAARIRATAYPQAEDFAARYVLETPSEETMLEVYGRAELR